MSTGLGIVAPADIVKEAMRVFISETKPSFGGIGTGDLLSRCDIVAPLYGPAELPLMRVLVFSRDPEHGLATLTGGF